MAILAIFTGKGITKSHYEALRREADWVHRWPEGIIFHAAAFDPAGGIRVADVNVDRTKHSRKLSLT